ncbi:MAG: hypothetical protein ABIJ96_18600 [Elusimicrobiota bacterium]
MKFERIINDPKLMGLAAGGAAFLGVTVWSLTILFGGEKSEPRQTSEEIAKIMDSALQNKSDSAEANDVSAGGHLIVKKLTNAKLPASVITADSMEAEEAARDASARGGTLDAVRMAQMAAQQTARIGDVEADSMAQVKERAARPDKGSFEMINPLANNDYVAAGAAAIAQDAESAHDGPLSEEQAKTIKTASAAGHTAAAKAGGRSFVRGQAASGGAPMAGHMASARAALQAAAAGAGSTAAAAPAAAAGNAAPPNLEIPQAALPRSGGGNGPGKGAASMGGGGGGGGATMGGGGGGGGFGKGGAGAATAKPKETPVKDKSASAMTGQAGDFLNVADSYFENVVSKITDFEIQKIPALRSRLQEADAVLASLEQAVVSAKSRYRAYPEAYAAAQDIEDAIKNEQRPRIAVASADMASSIGEIAKVPGGCRRYVSHWDTLYYNDRGNEKEYLSYYQQKNLKNQGWAEHDGRWSKTVERREPIDPRAGALASHKKLRNAMDYAQHVRQYADITRSLIPKEFPPISRGMPSAEAEAFQSFGETVGREMKRVLDLIPQSLMVGSLSGDLGPIQKGVKTGREDIRELDKKAKADNLGYPQTRDLQKMQSSMTDAVGNSNQAYSHVNSAADSLSALVRSGEAATAAYIDVCDARLSMQELAKSK